MTRYRASSGSGSRYLNELCRLRCAADLMGLGLFPNAKEITESFGAYAAVREHLRDQVSLSDPGVSLIAVGDGFAPRTAATFAFRSAWQCYSVDPNLRCRSNSKRVGVSRVFPAWPCIKRLELVPRRIEDWKLRCGTAVVVAVHSHATLSATMQSLTADRVHVVAMPCCVPQELSRQPDVEYEDQSVWSPCRTVKVWRAAP